MRESYTVYTIDNEIKDNTNSKNATGRVNNLNEFKHLDKGWSYMILFASFGTCCLVGANNYGTGIIHKILLERYKESVVLTSWSGSIQLALMCMSAPLSSAVIDKYSCRTSVILSGILFVSGYWATAFAPNMRIAIFTCGVTAGIAAGLGYTASIVAIGFNFRRRKHIALGITLSGMGAGIFAFAPLMDLAYAHYGSTGFFIFMATASANVITFGTLYFPSKLEKHTHKQREIDVGSGNKANNFVEYFKMYSRCVLKKPIILLSLAAFAFCSGTDLVFLNLPTFVTFKGFSSIQAALIVSLNGIFSVLGRFITGLLASCKKINEIWLYSGCLSVVAVATVIYPVIANIFEGHLIFSSILGLFFGSGYVLISPVCSNFVDIHFTSAAIGFVLFFGGAGSGFGPLFAGILLDNGGTYDQCLYSAAPLSSAVTDKYSCRTSVILSGLLFVCGYWATAFAPNMRVAIFTCGVTAGIAAGLGYTASIVAIGFNFRRRKQIALGITLSGMGAGIFACAPLMDLAYVHYGSMGFFIVMATMSANIITFGTLYFPSKLEIHTHKQREMYTASGNKANKLVESLKMYSTFVLKKPIILLSVAVFAFCGGTDLVFLNLPSFVTFKGFPSIQAAFTVSLNGIFSVIGRFITGLLANCKKINVILLYSGCLSVVAVATVIYPFIANFFEGHLIFSSIFGLFFGSGYVLLSPLCSNFVDIQFVSAAIGFVLFFGGAGSVFGPMFAGILLDNGGTYDQCLYSGGCFVFVASVLGLFTSCYKRKQRVNTDDSDPIGLRYCPK